MKLLLVCGLVTQLAAQVAVRPPGIPGRLPASAPLPPPALGGSFGSGARTNPLGGVALPTFGNTGNRRQQPAATVYPYFAPIYYTPLSYDAGYDYSAGYSQTPPPGYGSAAPAPPVIINQYFAAPPPDYQPRASAAAPGPDDAASPGDPLAAPQTYYLIAYKDHTVYPALTYWLEGDTLHYVTTQNTHNQASLSLIDLDKTYKLNEDRSVPFSIPGK